MRRGHVSLKQVLKNVLPAQARERVYSVELVRTRWADVVGRYLARRSEPEALSQGVLTVRVTDATWGKMIYRLQGRIIPSLNRALGASLVRRINFTKRSKLEHAVAPVAPAPAPPPSVPPSRLVEAATAIEDPELKAIVLRAGARYLDARDTRRRK